MATSILVVEDEPLIAHDIQRTLIGLGYEVPVTVASGREAITAVHDMRPRLVLMDIKLRGAMDGVEAARLIREQFEVPVVYLTSYSDDATLTRAKQSHPFGYLVKPFNDRELRAAIEVALDKHELEARLAHRERWFSTTLQSIGDAVIATDLGETITLMNGVAEELTGWKREEAIGRKFDDVVRLVDASGTRLESPVRTAFEKAVAVHLPASTDLLLKNGTAVSIDDTAAPIVDAKGKVLGGVMVFRDVTERRKLERELIQSERLTALGTIAAGMAHEINNPLSAVILNAGYGIELLQSALALLADAKGKGNVSGGGQVLGALWGLQDTLEDVNKNAERVRAIIHNVRRIVRAERTYKTTLHLIDVLDVAAKMSWNTIRHHARLVKDYGTTPRVEANEGQLTQVFTNLIVNASQAIGDGDAERNEIHLTTRTDSAGRAVVEVRDTGPGIPPHVIPRIFDPFFTTKAIGVGMGLGLSICHGIIVTAGGEITVDSELGKGTTFRITLPPASGQQIRMPEGEVEARPRRAKILIIDDDIEVGMSMERALRDQQDVTLTADGRQALAKIGAGVTYDVIFCDLMMPNMSGMDVYEALSITHPGQAKRIAFMTGGALSERSQEFLERTGMTFLSKPFTIESVRAVIQQNMKNQSQ
jgi:two-component system cell cycle sensor histidine kinase/response regulator CckA